MVTRYVSAISVALFLLAVEARPLAAQLKKVRFAVATTAALSAPRSASTLPENTLSKGARA